ncbi:MAG: hypothetical protein FMNOHCHN_03962 [Ignavibacteriaceae bacterium]|nr:hypothetical protein [Ignavibacteriaceae bacterium]
MKRVLRIAQRKKEAQHPYTTMQYTDETQRRDKNMMSRKNNYRAVNRLTGRVIVHRSRGRRIDGQSNKRCGKLSERKDVPGLAVSRATR